MGALQQQGTAASQLESTVHQQRATVKQSTDFAQLQERVQQLLTVTGNRNLSAERRDERVSRVQSVVEAHEAKMTSFARTISEQSTALGKLEATMNERLEVAKGEAESLNGSELERARQAFSANPFY